MGSKRKIAPKIMDYICAQNPNAKYFYDLFGGGGAISFEALQRKQFQRVVYNELNTGVVELLKKIRVDGVNDEFYQWRSRDEFMAHKGDDDWLGGLLKTCWSFGNNQQAYLFGKDVEPIKKAAHDYLMVNGYDKTTETRVRLIKEFKTAEALNGRFNLEQLERLEQLEQLERLERLEITNESYADVVIDTPINETVIYLDPPYKGTAQYAKKLDHIEFDEYVKNSLYKIYVSGYESELPCVFALNHASSLSAISNKKTIERLFCNQQENNFFNLF
jgi:site-specific DNA-adenine methylase